jgi:hypothetical protein
MIKSHEDEEEFTREELLNENFISEHINRVDLGKNLKVNILI